MIMMCILSRVLPALFQAMDALDPATPGFLTEDEWMSMAMDLPGLSDEAYEQALVAVLEGAYGMISWPVTQRTYDRAARAAAIFDEVSAGAARAWAHPRACKRVPCRASGSRRLLVCAARGHVRAWARTDRPGRLGLDRADGVRHGEE